MPSYPLHAVAFDLDGTLVDSLADLAAAANAMRQQRGLSPLSAARVQSFVGDGAPVLVPLESDTVMTLAPSCMAFSTAYCATLPEPDTDTRRPSNERPRVLSISCAKYTVP